METFVHIEFLCPILAPLSTKHPGFTMFLDMYHKMPYKYHGVPFKKPWKHNLIPSLYHKQHLIFPSFISGDLAVPFLVHVVSFD